MSLPYNQVLVTGSSGSLGKQLLYELVNQGNRPTAHLRKSSNADFINYLNLPKKYADLRIRAELIDLVQDTDAIIHTAAWVNFRMDKLTQFTGINTIGAVDLFKAASAAGVKRFVHVSTIAAVGAVMREKDQHYTNRPRLLCSEEAQFNLDHLRIPYIMTKHAAEAELLAEAENSKTELVIVNPSMIIAPSRSKDDRGKAMKTFKRHVLPSLPNWTNFVDVRDVAKGVILALQKGMKNERYLLTGDNICVQDLLLTISTILDCTPHLKHVSSGFAKFIAQIIYRYTLLTGKSKISIYPDLAKMLDYDWTYTHKKAQTELGFMPRSVYSSLEDLLTNNFIDSYIKPK